MTSDPESGQEPNIGALMRASRLGFDFVTTVLVCIGLGWLIDRQAGTAPWFLLGLMFFGFVAGFWRLWRSLSAKE